MIFVEAIIQGQVGTRPAPAARLARALAVLRARSVCLRCCDNRGMTTQDVIDQAVALAYRLAGYALLNLADDAAILALIFC